MALDRIAVSLRLDDPSRVDEAVDRAFEAGYERLVIEPPLHAETWAALVHHAPRNVVVALRLFLPSAAKSRPWEAPGVRFGSLDRSERRLAIESGLRTLAEADRVGCPRVLVPIVRLDDESLPDEPVDVRRSSAVDPELRRRRRGEAEARLSAVLATLEPLLSKAGSYGLSLALRVTNRARELPLVDEAERILEELAGAPLDLWLDTDRFPPELVDVPSIGHARDQAHSTERVRGLTVRAASLESARDPSEVVLRHGLARAPLASVDLGANASRESLRDALETIAKVLDTSDGTDGLPLFGI